MVSFWLVGRSVVGKNETANWRCLEQDVEFDCFGSRSLPFYLIWFCKKTVQYNNLFDVYFVNLFIFFRLFAI